MDLYLLALAFHSTTEDGINHAGHGVCGIWCDETIDERMREHTSQYIETYLQSFYRMCVVGAVFGHGLFAQPIITVMEKSTSHEDYWEAIRNETNKYPLNRQIYNADARDTFSWEGSERVLFEGFFE